MVIQSLRLDTMTVIHLNAACIQLLDLTPARIAIERAIAAPEPEPLRFQIWYPRDEGDPREWSEIPEVRLWFIRLDATYPWLPYFLDWREGELTRYAAMLVPHQFRKTEGIAFNTEALEIFVMHKVFAIALWQQQHHRVNRSKLQQMTQTLGYEVEEGFFALL